MPSPPMKIYDKDFTFLPPPLMAYRHFRLKADAPSREIIVSGGQSLGWYRPSLAYWATSVTLEHVQAMFDAGHIDPVPEMPIPWFHWYSEWWI